MLQLKKNLTLKKEKQKTAWTSNPIFEPQKIVNVFDLQNSNLMYLSYDEVLDLFIKSILIIISL